jgi:hypothetical protein
LFGSVDILVVALDERFNEGPGFKKQLGIPIFKPSTLYRKRTDCDIDPGSIRISPHTEKRMPLDLDLTIDSVQDEFLRFLVFPFQ